MTCNERLEALRQLIADALDNPQNTPAHQAFYEERLAIVEELIAHEADAALQ